MINYRQWRNYIIGPFQIDNKLIKQQLELLKTQRELLLQEQQLENKNLEKELLIKQIEMQYLQNAFWTAGIVGVGLDGLAAISVIKKNKDSAENNKKK